MFLRNFSRTVAQTSRTNIALYEQAFYNFSKIKKFVLPDLGEKIKEATIKKWHVKEGDLVEEYQTLVDVATDKLFTQIPSSEKGKIHKTYFKEDENCEVGQVLLEIEVDEAAAGESAPTQSKATSSSPSTQAQTSTPTPSQTIQTTPSHSGSSQTLATPATRALARQHNIDLSKVAATGKGGRITKEDILNFIQNPQASAQRATTQQAAPVGAKSNILQGISKKVVTMTDFQKGMQKSMTEAASIPHFNFKDEFDVTKLNEFRDKLRKNMGIKITFMPLIIKAVSLALNQYPVINALYDKEKPFEYTLIENHNISFAIDSPKGLVVPNIKNVQNMTVLEVHEEFNRIVAAAQAGTLGFKDLTDGTFSISNIGNIGGTYLGPVLLAPQVCIVAIGKTQLLPRYIQEENGALNLQPRKIMNVSFGCDHRVLDGATVARFSNKWKEYMENPENMLLAMR